MEGFRSRINWRNGGFWKCSWLSSKCTSLGCWGQSAHRNPCFVLLLLYSASYQVSLRLKKVRNVLFPLAVAVPGPAALTIFGPQLCLGKCPKEESALPKKKSKLGDDVASGKKNRDLFRELHAQGLPQCPQARCRLLNKNYLPTFPSWINQKLLRIWSF